MKLSLNQKRFLIVWILFHSFALFVNLADIKGTTQNEGHLVENGYYKNTTINLLTSNTHPSFWPFVNYYEDTFEYQSPNYRTENLDFNGIFYSYSFSEYIFYILLGLAIIFVPKLWNDKKPAF